MKIRGRKFTNPHDWSFYRGLIMINEEQNAIQTRSKIKNV